MEISSVFCDYRASNPQIHNFYRARLVALWNIDIGAIKDINTSQARELLLQTVQLIKAAENDVRPSTGHHDCEAIKTTRAEQTELVEAIPRQYLFHVFQAFFFGCTVSILAVTNVSGFEDGFSSQEEAVNVLEDVLTNLRMCHLNNFIAESALAKVVIRVIGVYVEEGAFPNGQLPVDAVIPSLIVWVKSLAEAIHRLFAPLYCENFADEAALQLHGFCIDHDVWENVVIETAGRLRTTRLYDLVWNRKESTATTPPEGKGELADLKIYLNTPAGRSFVSDAFEHQLVTHLLHSGSSTVEVLDMYMEIIEVFTMIDPSRVLLHRISNSIRTFLANRNDAVTIIIQSLLSNHLDTDGNVVPSRDNYSSKIASVCRAQTSDYQYHGYFEGQDLSDPDWIPEPIDAAEGHKELRHLDRLAHLVSLETKENFIKELQHVMGERLLQSEDFDFANEVRLLGMLRTRFEESYIQQCDIMLRDVGLSQRIDRAILSTPAFNDAPAHGPAFHTTIMSHAYWPAVRDESFRLPPNVAAITDTYAAEYRRVKSARRLDWLAALGRVTVELELTDRTILEEVTTWQAAVIHSFDGPAPQTRSVEQLTQQLEMSEALIHNACTFWVGKLVLRESAEGNVYTVIESLPTPTSRAGAEAAQATVVAAAAAAAAAQAESEAAGAGALKSTADLLAENAKVYASFVMGMLTNNGAMPTKRILMMLKMVVPGGFPFEEAELVEFMQELSREEKVERAGALWKAVKK